MSRPRAPAVCGIVLGPVAEQNSATSIQATHPGSAFLATGFDAPVRFMRAGIEFPGADEFVMIVAHHFAGKESDMKIDGRCHCGYVAYEAEIDPEKVLICHCADCQTLSGSAFRTVALTREDTFKLLSGELKIYVKTGESGTKRQQSFCPECGTPIYSGAVGEGPKVHGIRVGTARQRDELVPKTQLWFRSSQRWLADLGSVPKVEKQPAFDRKGGIA